MSYSDADVQAATTAMDKYRGGDDGEAGSALVVVGLSAERVKKEAAIRDDMSASPTGLARSSTNSLKSPASDKSQWRPSFPLVTTERLTTHIGAAEASTSVPQAAIHGPGIICSAL